MHEYYKAGIDIVLIIWIKINNVFNMNTKSRKEIYSLIIIILAGIALFSDTQIRIICFAIFIALIVGTYIYDIEKKRRKKRT